MPTIDLSTSPASSATRTSDTIGGSAPVVQNVTLSVSSVGYSDAFVVPLTQSPTKDAHEPYKKAAVAKTSAMLGLNISPAPSLPPGGLVNPITGAVLIAAPPFVSNADDENDVDPVTITSIPKSKAMMRVSAVMPRLSEVPVKRKGAPDPALFVPESQIVEPYGYLSVVLAGKDVTFFRNVPCHIKEYMIEEPYGPSLATIEFPQVSMLEPRSGSVKDFVIGSDVEIRRISASGAVLETLWEGYVVRLIENVSGGRYSTTLECQGALFQADHILKQPELVPREEDIGVKIARNLNAVEGRRYWYTKEVHTGITSFSRGEWQPLLSGYVGDMLAEATTDDGLDQWTLSLKAGRRPKIQLKSELADTIWDLTIGSPGVEVSLNRDMIEEPTHIYGSGVDSNNRGYANLRAPDWTPDITIPRFPGSIDVGDSGPEVRRLQLRLKKLGYHVKLDGKYNESDKTITKRVQEDAGLPVTGVVNSLTWQAIWSLGMDSGRLDNEYYAPFAHEHQTEPYTYNANGTRREKKNIGTGPNDWDSRRIQVHRYRRFPDGTSKKQAFVAARAELNRDGRGGAVNRRIGTITLNSVCPENGSRWEILPGHTIRLYGFHGYGNGTAPAMLLRVISTSVSDDLQTVTLQVDTSMRDSLTLDAIKTRNREAATLSRRRSRRASAPSKPLIDSELIGEVEPHKVPPGKWKVVKVPLGYDPEIVTMNWTTNPPTRFCLAIFDRYISAGQLDLLVPTPLSNAPASARNPWAEFTDAFRDPAALEAAKVWPGPWDFKGTRTNYNNLPKTGSYGDGYLTTNNGNIWVWNTDLPTTGGAGWQKVGQINVNPTDGRVDPWKPSKEIANTILDLGFVDAVGGPGNSAGYWPGEESHKDADGNTIDPVTGKHYDAVSISIQSVQPPWVWIAEWAEDACTMEGVIRVAPETW